MLNNFAEEDMIMKKSLLKKLTVLLSLALVAVLLTGCAKKEEPKPTDAPAAEVTEEVKTEGGN